MKEQEIKEKLDEIYNNVERGHDADEVCFQLNKLAELIENSKDKVPELVYDKPTNGNQQVEIKDSIKITKNTKGYNYEFRLVAKEGVDMLSQVDNLRTELEDRIKQWENPQ